MHPALVRYLDRVLAAAARPPREAAEIREELADHLVRLLEAAGTEGRNEEEVLAMIEKEFGPAESVGAGIAGARKEARPLKRRARKAAVWTAAAVAVALLLKWQVVEAYAVPTHAMDPAIPAGSRILVSKISSVREGDLIVLEHEGTNYVAQVRSIRLADGVVSVLQLNRGAESRLPDEVPDTQVVGRVWLIAR